MHQHPTGRSRRSRVGNTIDNAIPEERANEATPTPDDRITLYHYTPTENLTLIAPPYGIWILYPSKNNAAFGSGQYFTNASPLYFRGAAPTTLPIRQKLIDALYNGDTPASWNTAAQIGAIECTFFLNEVGNRLQPVASLYRGYTGLIYLYHNEDNLILSREFCNVIENVEQ